MSNGHCGQIFGLLTLFMRAVRQEPQDIWCLWSPITGSKSRRQWTVQAGSLSSSLNVADVWLLGLHIRKPMLPDPLPQSWCNHIGMAYLEVVQGYHRISQRLLKVQGSVST